MTTVNNTDIVGLYDRLNRAVKEVLHSASAGATSYSDADIGRLRQYTKDLNSKHKNIMDDPPLDLVETHPRAYELRPVNPVVHVENPGSNDLIRLFELTRDELTASNSARLGSRLVEFDSDRFVDNVKKIDSTIDYIETTQPIDLPESTPKEPLTGKGR